MRLLCLCQRPDVTDPCHSQTCTKEWYTISAPCTRSLERAGTTCSGKKENLIRLPWTLEKLYGITQSEKILSYWVRVINCVHFHATTFVFECYCSPIVCLTVGVDSDSKELHSNGFRSFGVSTLCERQHGGLCCLICFLLVQCACERIYAMWFKAMHIRSNQSTSVDCTGLRLYQVWLFPGSPCMADASNPSMYSIFVRRW